MQYFGGTLRGVKVQTTGKNSKNLSRTAAKIFNKFFIEQPYYSHEEILQIDFEIKYKRRSAHWYIFTLLILSYLDVTMLCFTLLYEMWNKSYDTL